MNNVHKSSKQYKLSGKFHDHDKTLGSLFLLQEANYDPSVPKAACAMLGYILERYISKEGNAWTTDDMVTDVTGVKRGAVMRNRKILKKEGYVKVVKIGRRGSIGKPGTGTVYKPIFDKGWAPKLAQDAARIAANEIKQNEKYGISNDTSINSDHLPTPSNDEKYGISNDTPSSLPLLVYKLVDGREGTTDVGGNSGAGSPQPPAPEVAAVGPPEGFESFWEAYDYKTKHHEAKEEFEKLDPDAELLAVILEKAASHREQNEDTERPKKYWVQPHNWLKKKMWNEDGPREYKSKSPKSKPAAISNSKPDSPKQVELPKVYTATVERAVWEYAADEVSRSIKLYFDNGNIAYLPFDHAHPEHDAFAKAQRGALAEDLGVIISDPKDFIGLEITVDHSCRPRKFSKPAAKPNLKEAA